MFSADSAALLIIDIQERLFRVMHDREALQEKAVTLIQGAQLLDLPVILTEQYPKGLGQTIPAITQVLNTYEPVEKQTFSCCNNRDFLQALEKSGAEQVLVAGIETHVCIHQTVSQLLERDYHVEVVADAVTSRFPLDREIALQRMRDDGARLTTVEMALFSMLQSAGNPRFKEISKLVK